MPPLIDVLIGVTILLASGCLAALVAVVTYDDRHTCDVHCGVNPPDVYCPQWREPDAAA